MPERGFATETWDSDDWFQELNIEQRYLFIYLWTNNHCNQAGLYHITLTTIAYSTKIPREDLPDLLKSLAPKVIWYPDSNLVWVKNFLKRQAKSSKFVAAAAKSLMQVKDTKAVGEFIDYNLTRYSISVPYEYYIGKLPILTRVSVSDSVPDTVPVSDMVGGGGSPTFSNFRASLELLSSEIRERLSVIPSFESYLDEHEAMKAELASMGTEKGYIPRAELVIAEGRVDLCWFNREGKKAFGFEIDSSLPRFKSLVKLRALGCPSFVILRRGVRAFQWEQDILLIGLGRAKIKDEPEEEETLSANATPTSESEIEESLSPGDREIIATWCSVSGFSMPYGAAAELVARMRTEFADVNILRESKEWAVRKLSEPLTPDSRPSSQLWHWMAKAREIASRNGESAAKHGPRRNPEDTYKKCRECGWKGKTSERQCPACKAKGDEVYLEKDYTSGRYGHLVKQ